jgi:hypothetical protein
VDTRNLIALGMLLTLVVVALFKGAVQPNDVKEVVLVLGGALFGATVPRRPEVPKTNGHTNGHSAEPAKP